MKNRSTALAVAAAMALFTLFGIPSPPKDAHAEVVGSYKELTAVVPDKFVCANALRITVNANRPETFAGKRDELHRLLNGIKTRLSFDCPKAENILIEGRVDGKLVYRGAFSKATGWALVDLGQPSQPNQNQQKRSSVSEPASNSASSQPSTNNEDSTSSSSEPPSTETLQASNYNFSGLMSAIYDGRLNDVPDDQKSRFLVASILTAFNSHCEQPPPNVQFALMPYVSEQVRNINQNPAGPLEQVLKGMVQAQHGDFMGGYQTMMGGAANMIVQDAVNDGLTFIKVHGCGGAVYNKFYDNLTRIILTRSRNQPSSFDQLHYWALMNPEYREEHNIPDPAKELARQKTAVLTKEAGKSCRQDFDETAFCDCAINNLKAVHLSEDQWKSLSSNFRTVADLSLGHSEIMGAVRQCYKQ